MCKAYRDGDYVVLEAPDLERLAAYLALGGLVEEALDDGMRLRARPFSEHLLEPLESLCGDMPSDLLLDVLEALNSEGWLVDADRWIARLRRSLRVGPGILIYECDCRERLARIFSTSNCPNSEALAGLGFKARPLHAGLEAERGIKSVVEALAIYDGVEELTRSC